MFSFGSGSGTQRRRSAARGSDGEEDGSDDSDGRSSRDDGYSPGGTNGRADPYAGYDSSDGAPAFLPLEEHNTRQQPQPQPRSPDPPGLPPSAATAAARHATAPPPRTASSRSGTPVPTAPSVLPPPPPLWSLAADAARQWIAAAAPWLRRRARNKRLLLLVVGLFALKLLVASWVLSYLSVEEPEVAAAKVPAKAQPGAAAPLTVAGLLRWTQEHPVGGMLCLVLVIAGAVVVMVPVGTPLTLGCGYIYRAAYGWRLGLGVATLVALGGSALGAVTCFLLGRYLMREQVRAWTRHYPLFGAIDVATRENGLKIMAMLYLTPILPLGPVSYMCGTTSMRLSHFVIAKAASLPLMFLYTFIGASMSALIGTGGRGVEDELREIEQNRTLIVAGVAMSVVMIAGITHHIKRELHRILERQQKLKPGEREDANDDIEEGDGAAVELKSTRRRAV